MAKVLGGGVSDSGRHLHNFRPMVSLKSPKYMFIPFITEKRAISQLRLGYVLNEYRYKVGLQESPKCRCGEIETVEHYICECQLYEMERRSLLTYLFYQTGEQS